MVRTRSKLRNIVSTRFSVIFVREALNMRICPSSTENVEIRQSHHTGIGSINSRREKWTGNASIIMAVPLMEDDVSRLRVDCQS